MVLENLLLAIIRQMLSKVEICPEGTAFEVSEFPLGPNIPKALTFQPGSCVKLC